MVLLEYLLFLFGYLLTSFFHSSPVQLLAGEAEVFQLLLHESMKQEKTAKLS